MRKRTANKNHHTIGSRLRYLREREGLHQYEVAERLSIAQKNVCAIEKREDVYLSTLQRYAEALGGNLKIIIEFNKSEDNFDLS